MLIHGHAKGKKSPTYKSWLSARERCYRKNNPDYRRYGGRGIVMCERWNSFENFLEDMGERPEGTTLDRYPDKDGNYEPSNCRWATPKQQANNRGRYKLTEIDDERIRDIRRVSGLSIRKIAGYLGISYTAVRRAL